MAVNKTKRIRAVKKANPGSVSRVPQTTNNPNPESATADNLSPDTSASNLLAQKNMAWQYFMPVRRYWWDRERMLITRLADSYSLKSTRSHVTDGHISTLAFERQARVAAQLPTGSIYSLSASKDAEQSATLMNLILNKYIWPNANSQMDALTKIRMSGVYASMYGACPILYDYRIDDEYIGPDFWLIPARNFLPQPGKNSIRDCEWVMVSTMVSVSYLESILERKNTSWNKDELRKLIDMAKKGNTPSRDIDSSRRSAVENVRVFSLPYNDSGSAARVELITKYEKGEKGRWVTFAPDYVAPPSDDKEAATQFKSQYGAENIGGVGILRSIKNPHKSGRIPIVMRQCFPLMDSIWGLGDFERGSTLQKAKDSLINMYLDGVKLSIFPPLKIDPSNTTMSTIKMQAGARWFMKDPNAVQPAELNPAGLQTFQSTYSFLSSALLNQWGTTDTQVSRAETGNPAFGKTPQAIEMMQDREGARDNWDRYMVEKMLEDLIEGMLNLLSENQEKPINFHVFDADVEKIMKEFGDKDDQGLPQQPKFMNMVGNKVAKLSVPKSLIGGKYKYVIDGSSTMKQDEDKENQTMIEILSFYFNGKPIIDQALQEAGMKFNAGVAIKKAIFTSGIQDPDEVITEDEQDQTMHGPEIDPEATAQQFQDPDIQNAVRQMFNPQQQGVQGGQPSPNAPIGRA